VSVGNARVIGSRRRRLPTHSTAAALSRRRRITSRLYSRRRRSFLFHLLARILLRRKQKAAALQLGRSSDPFGVGISFFSSFLFSRRIFLLSFSSVLRFGVSFIRLIFRVTIVNPLITGSSFFPTKNANWRFQNSFVSPRVKCQLLRRRNWNWAAT
jgi:hypothetical protein